MRQSTLITSIFLFFFLTMESEAWQVPVMLPVKLTKPESIKGPKPLITPKQQFSFSHSLFYSDAINASATNVVANAVTPPPTDKAGLTDGWGIYSYSLSYDAAAKLGLPLIDLGASADSKIFIYDLIFYKNAYDASNNLVGRYGVGVRLNISATSINGSASFSGLEAIAASAEFQYAEVKYTIETFGLSGPKITMAAPPAGSYDISHHVQLFQAIDKLKEAYEDPTTVVTPEFIAVVVNTLPEHEYSTVIAKALALKGIANGWSCSKTIGKLDSGHQPFAENAIKDLYKELGLKDDNSSPRDNSAQLKMQQEFKDAGGDY